MNHLKTVVQVCLALMLAACGGSDLSVGLPGGEAPPGKALELEFRPGEPVEHPLPFRVSGGRPPYESSIEGCPDWVTLFPDQGILAGTAPVDASGRSFFCTYRVTESDPGFRPRRSASYGLQLMVTAIRTPPLPLALPRPGKVDLSVGTFRDVELPGATGGVQPYTYSFTCAGGELPSGMGFAPATRRFAGTPDARFRDSCTYSVTDSSQPAETVSVAVEVDVTGPVVGPLRLPQFVVPGNGLRLRVGERARITFRPATGGVPPYTYELYCPDPPPIPVPPDPDDPLPPGLGFSPHTLVLSGTPESVYRGPDCAYRVSDSATPPSTDARSVALIVDSERAKWRFEKRNLFQRDRPLNRDNDEGPQGVLDLPEALAEAGAPEDSVPVYRLDVPPPLMFDPDPKVRRLKYEHPESGRDPPLGSISTYHYQVLFGGAVEDTLCVDVSYRDEDEDEDNDRLIASVRIRDDAYFDGARYLCPPPALQPASASHATVSNPVHTALAPVHARRALDVAHGAVRERVRGWTPGGGSGVLTAIAPQVGLGSLSGESGGFDYTGSSESLSAGAEIGADSWQAGLVGSHTGTKLRYRAGASLAGRGYLAGEHDTEIFSLHPFAAWHMPSGGHVWTSLGAGTGHLRHRDDLGFPFWSRSDVSLRAYAAGVSVPVADVLAGGLEAEAGIEAFDFEIEGGGRISSSLPTLRGRDWRAGLAWRAPVPGTPSVSMAYRHLTGDGPEGGLLEAKGSISVEGMFDPRLTLTGNAEGSFGVGEYEHDSWSLSGGVRFVSGEARRGFGLELDTRLVSPDEGGAADVGIRGEVGYGLPGGPLSGTLRPHVGLIRYSGDGSLRRSLGVDLRDTPSSRIKLEVYDRTRDGLRAIELTLDHRF